MAGLTEHGLTIKRLHEVIADSKAKAHPIFQDLVPPGDIVDTSDSTTIGRLIGLSSPAIADLWEAVQQVYLAFDPNSATGIALDNLVAIGGITRFPESPTTADVIVGGNSGIVVSAGSVVRSSTTSQMYEIVADIHLSPENCHGVGIGITQLSANQDYVVLYRYSSEGDYLPIRYTASSTPTSSEIVEGLIQEIEDNHSGIKGYDVEGKLYVEGEAEFQLLEFATAGNLQIEKVLGVGRVVAQESGGIEQPSGTIDTIATPIFGWDSITNPLPAVVGRARETDAELRNRFRETKFQRATNIIESLYSALYAIVGVNSIAIYENDTDVIDSNGLPPHSFHVIVDGGLESEIASAIWLNRPTGILSVGTTSIDILDSFGYVRTIRFSRPEELVIFVRMSLTRFAAYPPNGDDSIKQAVHNYVDSLVIGQDLVFSRLYTPINTVAGHQVDSLEVSVDGVTWFSSNIVADLTQRIVLPIENISVT